MDREGGELDPMASDASQCNPTQQGPENEQSRLSGGGLVRRIGMRGGAKTFFGKSSCQIKVGNETVDDVINSEGVFYTDPYFDFAYSGPGSRRLRQFISPKLKEFELERQRKSLTEGYSSLQRGMRNLENAIFVDGN